jgi:hypothetical protein
MTYNTLIEKAIDAVYKYTLVDTILELSTKSDHILIVGEAEGKIVRYKYTFDGFIVEA